MERMNGKLSLGFVMLIAGALIWGTRATAGMVIEEYHAKLKGLQGPITKIEGNKITLKDQAGKLHTIRVRPDATDKGNKLGGFQVGVNVIVEEGRISTLPVPLPTPAASKAVDPAVQSPLPGSSKPAAIPSPLPDPVTQKNPQKLTPRPKPEGHPVPLPTPAAR